MIATNRPRAFSVCNSKDWPLMDIQRLRIAHTFTVLLARRMCENLNSRLGEGEMSPFGRERTDAFPVSKQEQAGARSFIITFEKAGVTEQAGVRSSIITFDVYVIHNIIEKYDNNRSAPYAFNEQPDFFG